ncbi:MAG: polyprenyl synthetase family protein [Lachnospiraceae bacterium]|nr:polyprenyl synthetase family protein [Lachnospiraceae bacterium]
MFEQEWMEKTKRIDEVIATYLNEEKGPQRTVIAAVNYSVKAGGKRLRPLFLVESNVFCGGAGIDNPLVCAFSAALELIHTYSLVHDDLPAMDDDMYRRGNLTTHAKYGEAMGILAGDALLNGAFEIVGEALSRETDAGRLRAGARALAILARKSGMYGMLGGQVVDVEKTGRPMKAHELDFVYRLKTGALLEAAMMIGAVLEDAREEKVGALEEVAAAVGMAFQIQDDILDVTSSEQVLGKSVHSDEKNHKTTYVTLYSMEQARAQVKQLSDRAKRILDNIDGDGEFLKALIEALVERKF